MTRFKTSVIYNVLILSLSFGLTSPATSADVTTTQVIAEQEDADAQYRLGFKYYMGKGVEQDYAKAFEWYLKSASQGNAEAQNNLGELYDKGKGVEQDSAKAFEWYLKAAEQGDAKGQFNVGALYHKGEGIEQSDSKAIEWYLKSASQGNNGAKNELC